LKPEVSIITPYLNAEPFLLKLIENIQGQTFKNWELLLIDDDSSDKGASKVEHVASRDPRVKPLRSPIKREKITRIGPWFARNYGLKHAQADLIAFLDVDDLWHPQKLEFQVAMHQKQEIGVTYCNYFTFEHSTRNINGSRIFPPDVTYRNFLSHNPIPISCSMLHKTLVGNGFEATFLEDYCFWLGVVQRVNDKKIINLNKHFCYYGEHLKNRNKNKLNSLFHSYHAYRSAGFGVIESCLCCVRWLIYHSLRVLKGMFFRKFEEFRTIDDHLSQLYDL